VYIALWIVGGIILLLLLLLIMKITIEVHAFYTEEEKEVYVHVYTLFGLIRIHIDVLERLANSKNKKKQEKEETEKEEDETEEVDKKAMFHALIKSIGEIHTIIKKFLKRVTIRKLTWHSAIGTGDAASTGMVAGTCWMVKGWALGLVTSYFQVKDTVDMNIVPMFQGKVVRTEMNVRLSFRLWSVLFCAISFLRYWRKQQVQYRALHANNVEQGGIS
jgi:Protein of unknown function (DUF2953)